MRYALIDGFRGMIWYICDADTPKQACKFCDIDIGGTDSSDYPYIAYEKISSRSNDDGYHVYETPAGWDCLDGEDEEQIAKVQAMPYCGFFALVEEEEQ